MGICHRAGGDTAKRDLPNGGRRGMSAQLEQGKAEILERVVAMIHERVRAEHADQVAAFTRQFYQRVDPEDLLERDVADLYGAALAQWGFAAQRAPGSAKIRVYSPRFEEHG